MTGANMNIDIDKRELISRRDAIEAVTDYIYFDVYGGMKPVEKCETEAKSILCDIQKVEPEPKWIPCSERMPEPRVDVWCCSDMGQRVGYYEEHIDAWYGRSDFELFVTAWMPLPEQYKGNKNE